MTRENQIEYFITYPCHSCNGILSYSKKKSKVYCSDCNFKKVWRKYRTNDYLEMLALNKIMYEIKYASPKSIERTIIECDNCKARFLIPNTTKNEYRQCSYCQSYLLTTLKNRLCRVPSQILPFSKTEKEALEIFEEWQQKGWFISPKFKNVTVTPILKPIYIPFGLYEMDAHGSWSGQIGHYYWENTWDGDEWKDERKTRWKYVSGYVSNSFKKVPVSASLKKIHNKYYNHISDYHLDLLTNFENFSLIEEIVGSFQNPMSKSYQTVKGIVNGNIIDKATSDFHSNPCDTTSSFSVNITRKNQKFEHIILPVWFGKYTYNDIFYTFAINGQTGIISGKKPLSYFRIIVVIITSLTIITLIIWLLIKYDVFSS